MRKVFSALTRDLGYKIIALLVSIVLWVLVSGRRDYVASKTVDLEFLLSSHLMLQSHNFDQIRIRATGPRLALRKLMDTSLYNSVTVSLKEFTEGSHELDLKSVHFDLPVGVEAVDVRPSLLKFEIVRKEHNDQKSQKSNGSNRFE